MNDKNLIKETSILEAVVQFKFENRLQIEDVFFVAKTVLDDFEYEKEQIMELPVAIRESDPAYKYAPYYRFIGDEITVRIAPAMLSFSIDGFYPGWSTFKEMIIEKYDQLDKITSEWNINTVSIRYIDFFKDVNIFDNISIKVDNPSNICGEEFKEERKNYVAEFLCKHNTKVRLQIVNNVAVPTELGTEQKGSIIDTDVHSFEISNYANAMEKVHEVAKATFFNILDDDFIKKSHLEQ